MILNFIIVMFLQQVELLNAGVVKAGVAKAGVECRLWFQRNAIELSNIESAELGSICLIQLLMRLNTQLNIGDRYFR